LGMNGWGQPFDVVADCAALDADLLVLQECWTPDGEPGTADTVASALGYRVVLDAPLARVEYHGPAPTTSARGWGPRPWHYRRAWRFERGRKRRRPTGSFRTEGSWSLALLSRIPVRDPETVWLGRLRPDPAERAVVRAVVDLGSRSVLVMGTHMPHLTDWSPLHYRKLAGLLPVPDVPAVLCGDMNLWGPPVRGFFPAWRRAVTGRTWPSHRPHSQIDHVLITESLRVVDARVAERSGSDHLPVVVRLALA
ncbi:MAG: hypothetical protein JO368_05045, partial [Acidimicrobiales bacterium]|nr:hypothetical protein [Acidimicrobiales bacterium]